MINKNIDGFEYIRSSSGIHEYKLRTNGLRVLAMEDNSAPVATFMITYHVGSRNEANGHTGSTHLLEHLMFKGSEKFNRKKGTSVWTILQDIGAQINATTWMDRTNYFELVPSEHLETAIEIEADRMRRAFISDEDRQSEMTVVRNEFEMGENSPFQALDKLIWGTAYQAHPYHHSTIGWRSDIENVPTERLKDFYNTFYWPNNATATVIGDFQIVEALSMIRKHFDEHPASPHEIPLVYTEEPPQEGPRRVTLKRAGMIGVIGIAHKMPNGLHEDMPALQLLGRILYGGKTSRFHKLLIEKGIATSVAIENFPLKDSGLFITYAFVPPGVVPEKAGQVILDEYEKIKKKGVTEDEVRKAKAGIKAELAFSRDGSYSIASNLNEAIATGDWTLYTNSFRIINTVKSEDIKRVANKYLLEDSSTTGIFIPKTDEAGTPEFGSPGPSGIKPDHVFDDQSGNAVPKKAKSTRKISSQIRESEPVDGLRLLTLKTGVRDVVTITGSVLGGHRFSPDDNHMVPEMMAAMIDQGTTEKTKYKISESLESIGAEITFSAGSGRIHFDAQCLKKDVDLVIRLLAEQLRKPAFNSKDIESVKKRSIGRYEQKKENTRVLAFIELMRSIYPKGHPNYAHTPEESIDALKRITRKDLKGFHGKNIGLGNAIIVITGDVPVQKAGKAIRDSFGGWPGKNLSLPEILEKASQRKGKTTLKRVSDKTSADLYLGIPVLIDRNHRDYYALMVGTFILGGNFSARMMTIIRDQMGLTYGVNSGINGVENMSDGYWYTWGTFAPETAQQGKDGILSVAKEWFKNGVTERELETKKTTITGSFQVAMGTSLGLAAALVKNAEQGRDKSYIDRFPDIIQALTPDEVNSAIKKHIDIERLHISAAGSLEKI